MQEEKQVKVKRRQARVALEAGGLYEFMQYVRSPWRLVWTNLLAGIFRGLGAAIGATVAVALVIWVLTLVVDFPLVGEYAQQIKGHITSYAEESRYGDDFQRLEAVLNRIEAKLPDTVADDSSQ